MEIRDLTPVKDPKGGGPPATFSGGSEERPRKKPPSDQLRNATFQDYIVAQSHPDVQTHGWKDFLRSNLFAALVIWILSQIAVFVGAYFLMYAKTNQLFEWKTTVDVTMKRMDDWGTTHGHYADERQDIAIIELQSRQKVLTEVEQNAVSALTLQSERNNQQDQKIATLEAQLAAVVPALADIKARVNFVADLLDERTKKK